MRPEGVIVPMVTPMRPDGSVDLEAVEPLLGWFAASGIGTIMVAGTSGEGHALDTNDLVSLAEVVAPAWRSLTGGHGRILITVSAPSTRDAQRRGEAVAATEPDGLVACAPYYFRYSEDELVAHFAALGSLGIPIVAYDTPRYTGSPFTSGLLDGLASMRHVVGIKMSAGDMTLVEHACQVDGTTRSLAVAQGDEDRLVDAMRLGACAIIPGVANVLPGLCMRLFEAARDGDWQGATAAQDSLRRMAAIHGIRRGVVTTKTAMSLLGRCPPYASAPFLPYDQGESDALARLLADLRDLTSAEVP